MRRNLQREEQSSLFVVVLFSFTVSQILSRQNETLVDVAEVVVVVVVVVAAVVLLLLLFLSVDSKPLCCLNLGHAQKWNRA